MPEHDDRPFADYLRRIEADLADLPPERRAAIRRELLAHMEDAAAEDGVDPRDATYQRTLIARLGPSGAIAAGFGQVHGQIPRGLRRLIVLARLFGGSLGIMGAPAYLGRGSLGLTLGLILLSIMGMLGPAPWWGRWRRPLFLPAIGVVLCAAGLPILYQRIHSFDLVFGSWLLIGGELLLASAMMSAPISALARPKQGALLGATLLLVSFVSPFSYLPNPLGLYYIFFGTYRFDSSTPFVNRFATLGCDYSELIDRKLGLLRGRTGLDPLDPTQPLSSYRILGQTASSFHSNASVDVEMRYADGRTRRYIIGSPGLAVTVPR